jgi:hypothetical protein
MSKKGIAKSFFNILEWDEGKVYVVVFSKILLFMLSKQGRRKYASIKSTEKGFYIN